jgi:hypothetical protein
MHGGKTPSGGISPVQSSLLIVRTFEVSAMNHESIRKVSI